MLPYVAEQVSWPILLAVPPGALLLCIVVETASVLTIALSCPKVREVQLPQYAASMLTHSAALEIACAMSHIWLPSNSRGEDNVCVNKKNERK